MNIRTKEDIQISKAMARVLRHKVKEYGLQMNPCGYVPIIALLSCKNGNGQTGLPKGTTEADLRRVIGNDDKKRYSIEGNMVRANQGHSQGVDIDDSAMLKPLTGSTLPQRVVHGTGGNGKIIRDIEASGALKRMGRRHIHMARDMPGQSGVISGMRKSCTHFSLGRSSGDESDECGMTGFLLTVIRGVCCGVVLGAACLLNYGGCGDCIGGG